MHPLLPQTSIPNVSLDTGEASPEFWLQQTWFSQYIYHPLLLAMYSSMKSLAYYLIPMWVVLTSKHVMSGSLTNRLSCMIHWNNRNRIILRVLLEGWRANSQEILSCLAAWSFTSKHSHLVQYCTFNISWSTNLGSICLLATIVPHVSSISWH